MDFDLLVQVLNCPRCGGEAWDVSTDPIGLTCRTCSSFAPAESGVLRLYGISGSDASSEILQAELADWESNADFYLTEVESPLFQVLHKSKLATYRLPPAPPALVLLDLGAGTGYFSKVVAALGHKVVSLDFAARMLELGVEAYDLAAPVHAMAGRLPFRDGAFDGVIANGVLHHCKAQGALSDTCTEVHRVLRQGGTFLIFDRNGSFLGSRLHKLVMVARSMIQQRSKFAGSASSNEPDFNDSDVVEVLSSGFEVEERRFVSSIPFFLSIVVTNTVEYAGFRGAARWTRKILAPALSTIEHAFAVRSFTVEQCLRLTRNKTTNL